MKKFFSNKYVRFGFSAFIYLFFVIWIGNPWLLIGLGIIFDFHVTKKVNWTFWKKRGVKKLSRTMEWVDALIFAVVVATIIRTFFIEAFTIPTSSMEKSLLVGDYLFVSKVNFGPKMPNTPLSIPFMHHTIPFTQSTKSYIETPQWDYHRLAGLSPIKNNDVVVFNFPEGDTVCVNQQSRSFYQMVRDYGRAAVESGNLVNPQTGEVYQDYFGKIITRPVDKRENYIKRCIAISGDSLEVRDGVAFVNDKQQENIGQRQYKYLVETDGSLINPMVFDEMNISQEDRDGARRFDPNVIMYMKEAHDADIANLYVYPLEEKNVERMKTIPAVKKITKIVKPKGMREDYIFPHDERYNWNEDNFGPLYVPQAGKTIALNINNLPLYRRIITAYEHNTLEVKDSLIIINGTAATSYTFKMNYYFMMGDSRHNSADSRFWGFVPEDHVVGKALFIWWSTDKDKNFLSSIRWNRIFKGIE